MKHFAIVLFLATMFGHAAGQSQFEPGVFAASGSVSYSNTNEESAWSTIKSSSFSFSPGVTYFVINGLEASVGPSYYHSSSDITNTPYPAPPNSTTTSLGISLGMRCYLPSETVAPFVGVRGQLYWYKNSPPFGSDNFSSPRKYYGAELGADFFVTPHFAVEPSLQYARTEVPDYRDRIVSLSIGFKYFVF